MDGLEISRARAKASRPSYRRGGLVLGRVDWVEFSEESVDLVGLRALLGDPIVLIEVVGESGEWVRLSAEQRTVALEILPSPGAIDPVDGALTFHPEDSAADLGGAPNVTEFSAMRAEVDDLRARLATAEELVAALKHENAQLKAKAAAKPPKPAPAAKAPKAAKPSASPAPADGSAPPAAEAAPSEIASEA